METKHQYYIGPYRFDAQKLVLYHGGDPVRGKGAGPTPLRALRRLLEANGDVVTHAELIDAVWSGRAVYENSLNVCLSSLRRRLGEHVAIEAIHRVGFRLKLRKVDG